MNKTPNRQDWKDEFRKRFGSSFMIAGSLEDIKKGSFLTDKHLKAFISNLLAQENRKIVEQAKDYMVDQFLLDCNECASMSCDDCQANSERIDNVINSLSGKK